MIAGRREYVLLIKRMWYWTFELQITVCGYCAYCIFFNCNYFFICVPFEVLKCIVKCVCCLVTVFYVYTAAGIPTNLIATDVGPSSVTIGWTAPANSVYIGYRVTWSSTQVMSLIFIETVFSGTNNYCDIKACFPCELHRRGQEASLGFSWS